MDEWVEDESGDDGDGGESGKWITARVFKVERKMFAEDEWRCRFSSPPTGHGRDRMDTETPTRAELWRCCETDGASEGMRRPDPVGTCGGRYFRCTSRRS